MRWLETEEVRQWASNTVDVKWIEMTRSRPWSRIWHLETDRGTMWIKQGYSNAPVEGVILRALEGTDGDLNLIAVDERRMLTMLPDGGPTLRVPDLDADGWISVVVDHARLQRALVDTEIDQRVVRYTVDEQIADAARLGVNGRRLRRFARIAHQLDGGLPSTLVHGDVHAGNVLASGRTIDWGDAVVGHPALCLRRMIEALAEVDPAADPTRLTDAYCQVWDGLMTLEPRWMARLAEPVSTALFFRLWFDVPGLSERWPRALENGRASLERMIDDLDV